MEKFIYIANLCVQFSLVHDSTQQLHLNNDKLISDEKITPDNEDFIKSAVNLLKYQTDKNISGKFYSVDKIDIITNDSLRNKY